MSPRGGQVQENRLTTKTSSGQRQEEIMSTCTPQSSRPQLSMVLTAPLTIMCVWRHQCPVTLPACLKGAVPVVLFGRDMWSTSGHDSSVDCELSEVMGTFCVRKTKLCRCQGWQMRVCRGFWGKTKGKLQKEAAERGR